MSFNNVPRFFLTYFHLTVCQSLLLLVYTLPQGIKSHLFDSFIIFIIGHILRLLPAPLTDVDGLLWHLWHAALFNMLLLAGGVDGGNAALCATFGVWLYCAALCVYLAPKRGCYYALHSSLSPLQSRRSLSLPLALSVCLSPRSIPCA